MSLSVDDLYSMVDDDAVTAVRDWFVTALKNAPSVKSTFFPNAPATAFPFDAGVVDNVAVGLVCSAISRSGLFKFSATIRHERARDFWRSRLENDGGRASFEAYKSALSTQCKSKSHVLIEYALERQEFRPVWTV